jgi:hypothetical protein
VTKETLFYLCIDSVRYKYWYEKAFLGPNTTFSVEKVGPKKRHLFCAYIRLARFVFWTLKLPMCTYKSKPMDGATHTPKNGAVAEVLATS